MSKYIYIEHGCPVLMDNLHPFGELKRSLILEDYCSSLTGFSEKDEWRLELLEAPVISKAQSFLAKIGYNPTESIASQWVSVGPFSTEKLLFLVKQGLEKDDDVIQQWFEAEEIIKLLTSAKNFDDIILAVDAINGGHESREETKMYVIRVIGSEYFEEF